MSNRWQGLLFLLITLFLFATEAHSACSSSYQRKDYSMALHGGAIFVSPTTAVGTEIFRQEFNVTTGDISVDCSPPAGSYAYDFFSNALAPSALSTVYQTNVPGVGIKFYSTQLSLPIPSGPAGDSTPRATSTMSRFSDHVIVALVKTDEEVGVGKIEGASLPVAQFSFVTIQMWQLKLVGTITINSPTCNVAVPSNTVNMGSHPAETFANSGAGSPWKDASILLNGCGTFVGHNNGYVLPTFNANNNTYSGTTLANNRLNVTITPYDGIVDAASGIINIATTGADNTPPASGIGIQLSSSQSDSGKINLSKPLVKVLPMGGDKKITIPIYVRYVKTGTRVSGGKANGKLAYTLEYQ